MSYESDSATIEKIIYSDHTKVIIDISAKTLDGLDGQLAMFENNVTGYARVRLGQLEILVIDMSDNIKDAAVVGQKILFFTNSNTKL
jgi:hypothetical protein